MKSKKFLFTSESVTEGHPDKVCDQISDAILDEFLTKDTQSRVAAETTVTTGMVLVAGEISSDCYVDIPQVVRNTIENIGYVGEASGGFDCNTCAVLTSIDEQSTDIAGGVNKALESRSNNADTSVKETEELGAGDQGIMFGYACKDTKEYMPLALSLSHALLRILSEIRREPESPMPYLRPDAKSQFTIQFSAKHKPLRVHTIVLSTQHDEFDTDEAMHARIEKDVREIVLPRLINSLPKETAALFQEGYDLFVNPTGKFVIGGPAGDTGLTGRKIIVDTYGGRGAHGGGAFSGKDPSKVDRSAAYAARHIAKNLVAAGVADECLVQLAYAIGIAQPVSVFVDTYGSAHIDKGSQEQTDAYIADVIKKLFDLRPAAIVERFHLKAPIYEPTASYGHFGREPYEKDGIEFFAWEKLDMVDKIKKEFEK